MRDLLIKLINLIGFYPYSCPCGHKTNNRRAMVRHINTHPEGVGTLDYNTGAISW